MRYRQGVAKEGGESQLRHELALKHEQLRGRSKATVDCLCATWGQGRRGGAGTGQQQQTEEDEDEDEVIRL
jgi:hypothetical protein